jgi:hypothetical protein
MDPAPLRARERERDLGRKAAGGTRGGLTGRSDLYQRYLWNVELGAEGEWFRCHGRDGRERYLWSFKLQASRRKRLPDAAGADTLAATIVRQASDHSGSSLTTPQIGKSELADRLSSVSILDFYCDPKCYAIPLKFCETPIFAYRQRLKIFYLPQEQA